MGFTSWVSSLDMAPASYQPVTNRKRGYTLCCCGCLSLMLWLLMLLYVLMYVRIVHGGGDRSSELARQSAGSIQNSSGIDLEFQLQLSEEDGSKRDLTPKDLKERGLAFNATFYQFWSPVETNYTFPMHFDGHFDIPYDECQKISGWDDCSYVSSNSFYEVGLSSEPDGQSNPISIQVYFHTRNEYSYFNGGASSFQAYNASQQNVSYYLSGGSVVDYESLMPTLSLLFFDTSFLFQPSHSSTWAFSSDNQT